MRQSRQRQPKLYRYLSRELRNLRKALGERQVEQVEQRILRRTSSSITKKESPIELQESLRSSNLTRHGCRDYDDVEHDGPGARFTAASHATQGGPRTDPFEIYARGRRQHDRTREFQRGARPGSGAGRSRTGLQRISCVG